MGSLQSRPIGTLCGLLLAGNRTGLGRDSLLLVYAWALIYDVILINLYI